MHEVLVPWLGEAVGDATVIRWLKEEGDVVAAEDVLLEVAADKVVLEVEAGFAGVLRKVVAPAGTAVSAGEVIAYIGEPGEAVPRQRTRARARRASASAAAAGGRPGALSPMRRILAARMAESKATIPHYYLAMRVDVTRLAEVRQELSRTCGERVSYNDFIIAACARALREVPQVNCRWTGKGIEALPSIDIGLAVALDEGLVVPMVRRADALTVSGIAAVTRDLIEKARARRLTPEDYRGGSLTVTNLGMYGIDFVIPIINPGQPAILGVGQVAEEPLVHLGALAVRTVTRLTIACDHRVVDGAVGARFLEQVRADLEQPERLPLG